MSGTGGLAVLGGSELLATRGVQVEAKVSGLKGGLSCWVVGRQTGQILRF